MEALRTLMESNEWIRAGTGMTLLLVLAWAAHVATRRVFLGMVRRMAARTRSTWDDRLVERRVFRRVASVAPALAVYYGAHLALGLDAELAAEAGFDAAADPLAFFALVLQRVALAWIVVTLTAALSAFLEVLNDIYNERYAEAKNRPIKGYLQVVTIVAWIAAGIVVISLLAGRSPVVFLSGLGALTAILMLVFRDTILSLVASVQIMSNDMIRLGDWVEMPQANADGDVVDIALHTVKVQNWDKTITTIPTHRFITESFRNWRGMTESGGRRIKRALYLDMDSIRFLTDAEVETLSRFEILREYMRRKREEIAAANAAKAAGDDVVPEVRRLTNVGTFRAYVQHYLEHHPGVRKDMTLLVRQLPPTPEGLPLEIYCFSADTRWAHYEALQADIFDHLIARLPDFGLRAYQKPAGRDVRAAAAPPRGGGAGAAAGGAAGATV